jgi:hypothetical protein
MNKATQTAMIALLGADATITAQEMDAWTRAIRSGTPNAAAPQLRPVVTVTEAMRLLGVTRQTVSRYARNGLLVRVKSCGGERSRGYTGESVSALLAGKGGAA